MAGTRPLTKSSFGLRWVMLLLASLLMLGNYYCFDVPAATKDLLMGYMGMDKAHFETVYSLLYTVYSLPNIILPFFGGFFVDKFGARVCLVAFTLFLVIGQVVFWAGSVYRSIPVMLLGRVIYGLGGENLSVGQSALLAEWFMGKELAFAFSVNLSCSRLGSVINQYVSPVVAERWGSVNMALALGVIICFISLACGLVMAPVDKMVEAKLARQNRPVLSLNTEGGGGKTELTDPLLDDEERAAKKSGASKKEAAGGEEEAGEERSLWRDFRGFSVMFWALAWCCLVVYGCILPFNNVASSLLQERNYFRPTPDGCHLSDPAQCQSASNPPVDCPASPWYQPPLPTGLDLAKVDCSATDFNHEGACTYEYCLRQNAGLKQADRVASIPYTISAVLSPILGLCVDRFGKRATVVTLAPLVLILVHLTLGLWTSLTPVVPLIGQGLAYSAFAAVLWPSVPFTVSEDKVGLGYGLVTAIQNSGLALFPLVTASIYKASGSSYIPGVELFFVGLACLGVLGGICLLLIDRKNGHVLNRVQWHGSSSKTDDGPTSI